MSIRILYEVKLLLYSLFTGAGLMIVYDCLRIIRMVIPHPQLLTGTEDLIYWIYASIVTFSLLYELNDGAPRSCVIFGVFCGMYLYDRLVSRFFLKFLKMILKYLKMKADKCFRRRRPLDSW